MPGIDERIEAYMYFIWGYMIQWGLIAWHWITDTWDRGCEAGIKTLRAIEHAHKEDVYVFLDRNTHAIVLKEDSINDTYNNMLLFNPSSNTFILHNRLTDNSIRNSFDCVDVSFNSKNLTEFFINLRWNQGAAPSLLECLLLYGMLSKEPMSKRFIQTRTLIVLDSNAIEHRIVMDSELARTRFVSWN